MERPIFCVSPLQFRRIRCIISLVYAHLTGMRIVTPCSESRRMVQGGRGSDAFRSRMGAGDESAVCAPYSAFEVVCDGFFAGKLGGNASFSSRIQGMGSLFAIIQII